MIFENMSAPPLTNGSLIQQAVVLAMQKSPDRGKQIDIMDAGYMYPMRNITSNTSFIGIPPLMLALFHEITHDPLLRAAYGVIENAAFSKPYEQAARFESQTAYLFLVHLWVVFSETPDPTLADLLLLPSITSSFQLLKPQRFYSPIECSGVSSNSSSFQAQTLHLFSLHPEPTLD